MVKKSPRKGARAKEISGAQSELSKFFHIASDPNRLKILCLMMQSPQSCVSEIAHELAISVAITSHHLQTLLKAGFVTSRRDGKRICYSPSDINFIKDLKRLLCKYK